jgi:hypothetical protein
MNEICICAAIRDNTGYIWRGHRHADAIQLVIRAKRTFKNSDEGFVTSSGRFVGREEGLLLQQAAGIESSGGGYRGNRLFSEDLY